MKIPVLIVGYARPEGVSRILEALKDYEANIYVSIDGQKSKVENTRKTEFDTVVENFLEQNPNKRIEFFQRSQNVGAAVNVIDSIDACFEREDQLIVLEDDLIVSEEFLNFVEISVPIMVNNVNVKMIAGTNPFSGSTKQDSLFWASYPVVWGWATSKSNWIEMRKAIFDQELSRANFNNIWTYNFFRAGKNQSLNGYVDAWDLPLAGSFHAHHWKTLIPPANLISNIGFDESATHTSENVWPLGLEIKHLTWNALKITDPTLDNSLCLNSKMEIEIYGIRRYHILSYMKSQILKIISKSKLDSLQSRIVITTNKKRYGE